MPNSLSPAFVKIEYSSSNAPHVMILPTKNWNDPGDGTDGTFDDWLGGSCDADTMINDLVDELATFFTASLAFINYTIFTQALSTSDPIPRYSAPLAQVGLSVSTSWQKAVQVTLTARTTNFGVAKLTLLDAASENNWDKIIFLPGSGNVLTLFNEWTSTASGWAGRDGGRPATFLQVAKTLNEKLRRQYHMN